MVEIYWDDLSLKTKTKIYIEETDDTDIESLPREERARVLDEFGKDCNFDIFPVFTYEGYGWGNDDEDEDDDYEEA